MPAKGSDDLFRLIKSLSPAEKGYFKKFADRYSFSEKDNNYLKLFEAIDLQEEYDETKLVKKLFVNQLPRQKNYLQSLILSSLQVYDSNSSIVIEIENNIQQVRILLKRGQYDLCRKLLLKTKKEAIRYECFVEALKLVKFENHLNKESGMDISYATEDLNYEERYRIMAQEKNCDEVQQLEQQVIMSTRDQGAKKALSANKLLDGNYPILSLKANLIYHNTLSVYHNFRKEFEKQYIYSKKYMDLKREEFELFKGLYVYMPGFINYFFACYSNKRFSECDAIMDELLAVPVNNSQEEEFRHRIYMIIKTYLFIGTGKFEQALPFVKKQFEEYGKNKFFTNPRMDAEITRNVLLIYFANRQYKNCLKHIDSLLSGQTKENAAVMYYQSLLLNILVHYELGNRETAEHLIISARRTLKNNERLTPLEDILLSFLKKHIADESNKHLITDTIGKLKKIAMEADYHTHVSLYSFYLSWLESKQKNEPLAKIIMEKVK